MRYSLLVQAVSFGVFACVSLADQPTTAPRADSSLSAAEAYVRQSERYLHHSAVRGGMKGYGLTVLSGTEIVRFDVEVISVMEEFNPGRDVILARMSGQGLEKTGIIQGMSGSPVYLTDPADGRDKLIGAVAYGWPYQREPLCGIQPISQMLAVSGALGQSPASQPASNSAAALTGAAGLWRQGLQPTKVDFVREILFRSDKGAGSADQLRPLTVPLAGGLSESSRQYISQLLPSSTFQAVTSGQVNAAIKADLANVKLQPGSAVAVQLVGGDEDLNAIGTVTEVIGDRVIAFGHPMFSNGQVSLPMCTAYVHGVMPLLSTSFKLGGTLHAVGELISDEQSAVAGVLGRQGSTIPMRVSVDWVQQGQQNVYNYHVLRDRSFTPLLANILTSDSITGLRNLPSEHAVEYEIAIDFGQAGTYRVQNLGCNREIMELVSDLSRPLVVMLNNPFGMATIQSVDISLKIEPASRLIRLEDVRLDRNAYAPGQTVRAELSLWRWKGERFTRTIEVPLPADLPEGKYTLNIGDASMAAELQQKARPDLFDPRSLEQLLQSIQQTVQWRMDRLYAVLEIGKEGLTVHQQPMTEIPPTMAAALKSAGPLVVKPLIQTLQVQVDLHEQLVGSKTATVVVEKKPPGLKTSGKEKS